jgi:hypothetical protein
LKLNWNLHHQFVDCHVDVFERTNILLAQGVLKPPLKCMHNKSGTRDSIKRATKTTQSEAEAPLPLIVPKRRKATLAKYIK